MMLVNFTKMHGLGNDFVVIDAIAQNVNLSPEHAKLLGDRHLGIGYDQLLLIEPPQNPEADFYCRIFNADGSEAEQCGNGMRCVARYLRDHELTWKQDLRIETKAGIVDVKLEDSGLISVLLGIPRFSPRDVPFVAEEKANSYALRVDGRSFDVGVVSLGNPHCVLQVNNLAKAPVAKLGAILSKHARFPNQTNVGFMEVISPKHIRLRVYERGAGETLACGSGACAAVAIGRRWRLLQEHVTVELPGGVLFVSWSGSGQLIKLTGPARYVYEGQLEL